MAFPVAAAMIGMGALGALAGGQGNKSNQDYTSNVNLQTTTQLNRGRSGSEIQGEATQNSMLDQLRALTSQGPGASAISDSLGASNNLAQALSAAAAQGGRPGQDDIQGAQQFTSQMFAPQQTMLNQQFEQQNVDQARLAARLGRPVNDPILQAKMKQEQVRQQQQLGSQQTAFSAQTAQGFADRRLSLMNDVANVRGGLATQAFANRQSLATLGQQIVSQERNYRLGAANRSGTQNTQSGGGMAGAISGGLAGAGAGLSAVSAFGAGGGAAASAPAKTQMAGGPGQYMTNGGF
jgi:hypothetical protein